MRAFWNSVVAKIVASYGKPWVCGMLDGYFSVCKIIMCICSSSCEIPKAEHIMIHSLRFHLKICPGFKNFHAIRIRNIIGLC